MFTGVASLLCTKVHRAVKTFKNVFALPDGVIAYIFKLNVLAYSVVFFHIRLNFYIFSKITELKFRRRIARSDGGLLWRCIAQCESTERMLRSEALIERGSPTCSLAGSSLSLSLSRLPACLVPAVCRSLRLLQSRTPASATRIAVVSLLKADR